MSSSKRPSTSSLRRFITSRAYVPVAEIRRRFGIDDPDCMCRVERGTEMVFVGLPEREAAKIQDLWVRGEIGLERSVEVRAPVVVGIYPIRIARYVVDGAGNGHRPVFAEGGAAPIDRSGMQGRGDNGGEQRPPAATPHPTASSH